MSPPAKRAAKPPAKKAPAAKKAAAKPPAKKAPKVPDLQEGLDISDIGPKVEPDRDRWGRYLIPNPDGDIVGHTRVTTIAKKVDELFNVIQWNERNVAWGVANNDSLYAKAASHAIEEKDILNEIVEDAKEHAGANNARRLGDGLHRFTERVDIGDKPVSGVPALWRPKIELYLKTMADNGITILPQLVEIIFVMDNYTVAGTCDRVVRLADGRHVIADLKTGKDMDFGQTSMATQLATYAFHTATYDPVTKKRGPQFEVDLTEGIIIHLPSALDRLECHLHRVDLERGYDGFLTGIQVHNFQKEKGLLSPFVAPLAPDDRYHEIKAGILVIVGDDDIPGAGPAAVRDLLNRWPDGVPKPFPPGANNAQLATMLAVVHQVHALHDIPF